MVTNRSSLTAMVTNRSSLTAMVTHRSSLTEVVTYSQIQYMIRRQDQIVNKFSV